MRAAKSAALEEAALGKGMRVGGCAGRGSLGKGCAWWVCGKGLAGQRMRVGGCAGRGSPT